MVLKSLCSIKLILHIVKQYEKHKLGVKGEFKVRNLLEAFYSQGFILGTGPRNALWVLTSIDVSWTTSQRGSLAPPSHFLVVAIVTTWLNNAHVAMVTSRWTLFCIFSRITSVLESVPAQPIWPQLMHNKLCVLWMCQNVCVWSYSKLSSRRLSRILTRLSSPNTYPWSGPSCTAVSPRNPLKVEWAKSIIRTSTRGERWSLGVGGDGKEFKMGAKESGWGWDKERGGRKEW